MHFVEFLSYTPFSVKTRVAKADCKLKKVTRPALDQRVPGLQNQARQAVEVLSNTAQCPITKAQCEQLLALFNSGTDQGTSHHVANVSTSAAISSMLSGAPGVPAATGVPSPSLTSSENSSFVETIFLLAPIRRIFNTTQLIRLGSSHFFVPNFRSTCSSPNLRTFAAHALGNFIATFEVKSAPQSPLSSVPNFRFNSISFKATQFRSIFSNGFNGHGNGLLIFPKFLFFFCRPREENIEKVEMWRAALTHVGNLAGWPLMNRPFSQVIKSIVRLIWHNLNNDAFSEVTKGLVGIDSHVVELESRLDVESNDVRFIGIWAMGGMGVEDTWSR
ncbi:hypothetical protein CMV_025473 [Castanea mollissima]|uniref:Uncharacterized protein n=1 Tax=Castanea mollissima TaxID=60419 RepID=A0A8J4QD70_9ROSI|nr:hypothetical protein CMV_025473 [Castanea mollissima]